MKPITITSFINAPISKVWECWTVETHIEKWNFTSTEWHCPDAKNNLIKGGEFHYTMAAKDNSMSFDFWGTYQEIIFEKRIEIVLGDGRKVTVDFEETENGVQLTEVFDPENENPVDLQRTGWQLILDNFKTYAENQI
ncbi:MAG: SRPBCC domain-containing protein [Chitinophagaceae bacterium]